MPLASAIVKLQYNVTRQTKIVTNKIHKTKMTKYTQNTSTEVFLGLLLHPGE